MILNKNQLYDDLNKNNVHKLQKTCSVTFTQLNEKVEMERAVHKLSFFLKCAGEDVPTDFCLGRNEWRSPVLETECVWRIDKFSDWSERGYSSQLRKPNTRLVRDFRRKTTPETIWTDAKTPTRYSLSLPCWRKCLFVCFLG